MRPVGVVVVDVHDEDVREVSAAPDEDPVEALPSDRPDAALRVGVGPRCPDGCAGDADPLAVEISSKARAKLLSRSRITNPTVVARSLRVQTRLRACWSIHSPFGAAVAPARCTRRVSSPPGSGLTRLGHDP
jgi:hypothetical protein